MYLQARFNVLELDDELILDQEIKSTLTDHRGLVGDLDGDSSLKSNVASVEFQPECRFIDRLEKARAQVVMNFDRSPDHRARKVIQFL